MRKNNITLGFKNIISFLKILIGHFTGKEKIITLSFIILILSLVNIINTFTYTPNVSALDYSSNVGIGFTFNPTLSVSLSSSDLVIPNLIPGNTLDSNSINVSVATNASYGYTLSATVGDSTHNNSNLTHSNNTNIFSSIAIDADLSSLDEDEDTNIWGYSYRNNIASPSTWSNYNGLSSFSNTILLDNSNAADSTGSVDFKISAKAGDAQPSGEYTGTINFIAVTKVAPMSLLDSFIASGAEQLNGYYKMQDMTHDICNNVDIEESELQLIDVRDNKVYWVAKLKDGNCWMTQNLDLDLSHDIPLTSKTTDLNDSSLSGAYAENYTYDTQDNIIVWMPKNTTYDYKTKTGISWASNNNTAYSLNPGDWYWSANNNAPNCNYLTTACEDFSKNPYNNNTHSHIGNYYNWSAAIASDDSSSLNYDTYDHISNNPQNSICPKNWRLPQIGTTNDYAILNDLYNNGSDDNLNLISAPLYFTQSGFYYNKLYNSGPEAYYRSSSIINANDSYSLAFYNGKVRPTGNGFMMRKYYGMSVRCIAH